MSESRSAGDPLGALVPGVAEVPPTPRAGTEPLHGLTFVAKDVIDVAGTVTGAGNPDWAAAHEPASVHATAVALLLRAGTTLVGKGRCAEFAYSLSGDNVHYGMPRNAAAPDRDPGGSTSGPAAAVAAGVCDLGLGTDTLGSIRVPASYCGLFGYRPTHGTVSTAGVLPLAQRFDTVGLLSREAGVLARAADVLLGRDFHQGTEVPRLIVAKDVGKAAEPEVAEIARAATARLARDAGVSWTESVLFEQGHLPDALMAFSVLQGAQVWQNFGRWMQEVAPNVGPDIEARLSRAARLSKDDIERAEQVAATVSSVLRRLRPGEVLVGPTAGTVAPARHADADAREQARVSAGRLSCLASLAGAPAVSVPVGTLNDLPVGIDMIARPGADGLLLDLAAGLDSHRSSRK